MLLRAHWLSLGWERLPDGHWGLAAQYCSITVSNRQREHLDRAELEQASTEALKVTIGELSLSLERDLSQAIDVWFDDTRAIVVELVRAAADRHQVVFSHSLNARGRLIASGETEVVSPAKHKRDNAEAIFS